MAKNAQIFIKQHRKGKMFNVTTIATDTINSFDFYQVQLGELYSSVFLLNHILTVFNV